MDAGDEDIREAIVIVVTDGDTDVEAFAGETGFGGDVGEVAFAVIREQTVGVLGGRLFEGSDIGAVGEEDVEIAVVVEVEDGDATGHGFRGVTLRGFGIFEAERKGGEGKANGGIVGGEKEKRGGREKEKEVGRTEKQTEDSIAPGGYT